MVGMIDFYNQEADRLSNSHPELDKKQRESMLDDFIDTDTTHIAWTRALKQDISKDRRFTFDESCLVTSLYRPFNKQWLYFNRRFNEMVLQIPRFFPDAAAKNRVIGVSASDSRSAYSVFISDQIPSLHAVDMVGSQYFPLYLYDDPVAEANPPSLNSMLSSVVAPWSRKFDSVVTPSPQRAWPTFLLLIQERKSAMKTFSITSMVCCIRPNTGNVSPTT